MFLFFRVDGYIFGHIPREKPFTRLDPKKMTIIHIINVMPFHLALDFFPINISIRLRLQQRSRGFD